MKPANKLNSYQYKKIIAVDRFQYRECDILRQIMFFLGRLEVLGILKAWRQNTGMAKYENKDGKERRVKFGIPGMSDVGGYFRGGRALYIEVKREDGKLTQNQLNFLQNAHDMGCFAVVARSIDDVKFALEKEGYL
jgi:hypothetical protein